MTKYELIIGEAANSAPECPRAIELVAAHYRKQVETRLEQLKAAFLDREEKMVLVLISEWEAQGKDVRAELDKLFDKLK